MEIFDACGHLTDQALTALLQGQLPELSRLEAAEHLAYCDRCIQRCTDLFTDDTLVTPAHSCQTPLRHRIRQRALRILTSRYATAVAGVALMITILWAVPDLGDALPEFSQEFQFWPQRWSDALTHTITRFHGIFDQLGGL